MEAISVFDIFKIGVGPSSSHTMGPWRAAQQFMEVLRNRGLLGSTTRIVVELYGSLAKTGRGHGTDVAVLLALSGDDPVSCRTETIDERIAGIKSSGQLLLDGVYPLDFVPQRDIIFHMREPALPFHPNGLRFSSHHVAGEVVTETYYSVGGGFVVQEGEAVRGDRAVELPYHCNSGADALRWCSTTGLTIPQLVRANERVWRTEEAIHTGLLNIWRVMAECIFRGCHVSGTLPGGLDVTRRAAQMNHTLLLEHIGPDHVSHDDVDAWMADVRLSTPHFRFILRWVSTFALAVNEENAAFGRVVTAPTNGAAGVIPAVLMYYWGFCSPAVVSDEGIVNFLLTAGEIGSFFKKGATISAAMGGCQAEIGVSSAMAAGGLTQVLGGSPGQVFMAAEIAMEHHLGMTCDPIGGLVQVPCIERNTMGAIKAITAAHIALESDPSKAKVSLDAVIRTMWETSQDMMGKYKETGEGGLALNIPVIVSEC